MNKIIFKIFRNDADKQATDFDLGDIDFIIDGNNISSRTSPRFSNMIYVSITELIDGVLTITKSPHVFIFFGVDSSFRLIFQKTKRGVYIKHQKISLGPVLYEEMLKAIQDGIDDFMQDSLNALPKDSAASVGLTSSRDALRKTTRS